MDPSSAPWRALEDRADPAPEQSGPKAGPRGRSSVPRSAILTGAFAIVLTIAAFVLAFGSGSSGAVSVQGGGTIGDPTSGALIGPNASAVGPVGRVVVVEIVGAVDHPGVYRLPADSRVGDLVTAAGGYGPRVDTDRAGRELNLAAALRDGDQVRVPSRDDASAPAPRGTNATGSTGGGPTGPVDLNRATAAELDALPGIGPVTANKIISSRDEQPFAAVADLRTRKLVGEKTFEKLKDLVTVP